MLRFAVALRNFSVAEKQWKIFRNVGLRSELLVAGMSQNAGNPNKLSEAEANTEKNLPKWVQNSVDRDLYLAQNVQSLFDSMEQASFNRRNAVNLVTVLGSWISEGKLQKHEISAYRSSLENLLSLLSKDNFSLGMLGLIQSLKSLALLGVKGDSHVVTSLQNELLWNLRKFSLRQQLQVLAFEKDLESSPAQEKVVSEVVQNIQRRWVEITDARDFISLLNLSKFFQDSFISKVEDRVVELAETFSADEKAKVIVALGSMKRRPIPLLRALAFHLNKSKDVLTPRLICDLLFAMNRLNFHDTSLLEKICNDLATSVPQVKSSPLIGSAFTSLGQLRFHHTGILEALCDWVEQNFSSCRIQDLVSTVLCLGAVNFVPSNADQLFPKLVSSLNRDSVTSTTVWLDVAWSLAVLDQLPKEMLATVLKPDVVKELTGSQEPQAPAVKLKLSNLAGLAKLSSDKYNAPEIEVPSPWTSSPSAESPPLTRSVMDALANFVPPPKYLKENVRTDFGVPIDGLCIVNSECTPLLLSQYENSQQLPSSAYRIAVSVLDYKDLCLGSSHLTGISALRQRLLTLAGYRVVPVSYREFSPKDKLLKKVQFLEQLIKDAIAPSSSSPK